MTSDKIGTSRFAHPGLPAITSAILALILYASTLGGTYIYDDLPIVRDDPRVRDPSRWGQLWTSGYNTGAENLYRPLVSSSYAIEWFLHGDRPWIFHLVNVLLNAGVAAAIAETTRRGLDRSPIAIPAACIAGCLFAAHPLHVEAVANIVGRAELACALFVFMGLAILARRPLTTRKLIAILSFGLLGILCKEQGVLQPLLWLLLGYFVSRNQTATDASPAERRAVSIFILLTVWIWAGYLIGREHLLRFEWDIHFMDPTMQPLMRSSGIDRILIPILLIGRYTALFFWPAHLSLDYGGDVIGSHTRFADPYLWIGIVAIIGWCFAIGFAYQRRAGFVVFCLISMAVTYGVIGNIVTLIGTNFGERLIYLPSAFLLMAIAAIIAALRMKWRIPIIAAILLLSSIRTFTAAADWNDPLKLYQHSYAATPRSIQVHLLLSQEYRKRGNAAAADATLDEICGEYPNYWRVWMFRSSAAMDDGDLVTARRDLRRAIQLDAQPILLGVQERLQKLEAAKPRQSFP